MILVSNVPNKVITINEEQYAWLTKSVLLEGFQRSSFNVIDKTIPPSNISSLQGTSHLLNDRNERLAKIINTLGGFGEPIDSFIVDTGHPNGYEIHTICSNCVIIIQNERTERLITALIARPQQIKRYYSNLNIPIPSIIYKVLDKCRENQGNGFNNW